MRVGDKGLRFGKKKFKPAGKGFIPYGKLEKQFGKPKKRTGSMLKMKKKSPAQRAGTKLTGRKRGKKGWTGGF